MDELKQAEDMVRSAIHDEAQMALAKAQIATAYAMIALVKRLDRLTYIDELDYPLTGEKRAFIRCDIGQV